MCRFATSSHGCCRGTLTLSLPRDLSGSDPSKFSSSFGRHRGLLVDDGGDFEAAFRAVASFRWRGFPCTDVIMVSCRQYAPLLTDDESELDIDAMRQEVRAYWCALWVPCCAEPFSLGARRTPLVGRSGTWPESARCFICPSFSSASASIC